MTVELAHPSTEPLPQRSPTKPAHPRWWFANTTPGRILLVGVILAAMGILSAFATSTTIADRQNQLTNVLDDTEPLAFAAGRIYTTLSVADAAADSRAHHPTSKAVGIVISPGRSLLMRRHAAEFGGPQYQRVV